jgi:ketosteroid isomerase-like protein
MKQNTSTHRLAKGLRLFFCAALMAMLAVSQAPVRTAQASIFERVHVKEKVAFAEWQYQEGNVVTFVQVVVAESAAVPGSVEASMPAAAISIFRQTTDGIQIVAASGVTNTFEFVVDTALTSAQFSGEVELSDVANGTLLPVTVDLTWSGTGDLVQEHAFEQFREEGFIVISNFHGAHRAADAAGTLLGGGINFTPIPASSAQIQRNDNGGVTVLTGHDAGP